MDQPTNQSQTTTEQYSLAKILTSTYALCSDISHLRAMLENQEIESLDSFKLKILYGLLKDCQDETKSILKIIKNTPPK